MGKIWGGIRAYKSSQSAEILAAVQNLTETYPDPKAAVIVTLNRILRHETIVVFFFYDGPAPPDGVFGGLEKIHSSVSTVKTQSYKDFVCSHPFNNTDN
jgi:hypothetical protein